MHKIRPLLVILMTTLALLVFGTIGFAYDGDNVSNVITVSGEGLVKVTPNIAHISFAVITEDQDAETAQSQNALLVNKAVGALKNIGIAADDIATSGYNLRPRYVRDEQKSSRINDYEVSNEIRVTVRDIALMGKVIDEAVKNGINNVQGINFSVKDGDEYKAQALRQAVEDARAKANVIATALGKKIVGVKSASGNWYDESPKPMYSFDMAKFNDSADEVSTSISPGKAEIRANAEIVYIIE